MQQLIYVPPDGDYNDLSSRVVLAAQDNYILSTISGVGGVESSVISEQIAGMDGVQVQDVRAEPREIKCAVYVRGSNRRDMYRNRYALIRSLAIRSAPGMLYYSNDYVTVQIAAYPTLPPDFAERIHNYNRCDLTFYCPHPYWSALSSQTVSLGYAGDIGFGFPLRLPIKYGSSRSSVDIYYSGTAPAPVQITITGEAPSPILTNERTGDQIVFADLSLVQGDLLVINTARGHKSAVLLQDGVQSNAFNLLDPSTVFWELQPGRNVITYSSADAGKRAKVDITWVNQYAGV